MRQLLMYLALAVFLVCKVVDAVRNEDALDVLVDEEFEKLNITDDASQGKTSERLEAYLEVMKQELAVFKAENARLLRENMKLTQENEDLAKLKEENAKLKQAHKFHEEFHELAGGIHDQVHADGLAPSPPGSLPAHAGMTRSLVEANHTTKEPLTLASALGAFVAAEAVCSQIDGFYGKIMGFLKAFRDCYTLGMEGKKGWKTVCKFKILGLSSCGKLFTTDLDEGIRICSQVGKKVFKLFKRVTTKDAHLIPTEGTNDGSEFRRGMQDLEFKGTKEEKKAQKEMIKEEMHSSWDTVTEIYGKATNKMSSAWHHMFKDNDHEASTKDLKDEIGTVAPGDVEDDDDQDDEDPGQSGGQVAKAEEPDAVEESEGDDGSGKGGESPSKLDELD